MVVSLPLPAVVKKESQKVHTVEIRIPDVSTKIRENKLLSAFRLVLQAPVK